MADAKGLRFRTYLGRWAKRALWHAPDPIDFWSGTIGAVAGVVDHFAPGLQLVTDYGWQIPVFALAAVTLVRLILSPFWLAQEDAKKIAALTDVRDKKALKGKLQEFYVEVGRLITVKLHNDISAADFSAYEARTNHWLNDAAIWIEANLGNAARERFLDTTGMDAASVVGAVNETHNNIILNLTRFRANLAAMIENDAWV